MHKRLGKYGCPTEVKSFTTASSGKVRPDRAQRCGVGVRPGGAGQRARPAGPKASEPSKSVTVRACQASMVRTVATRDFSRAPGKEKVRSDLTRGGAKQCD